MRKITLERVDGDAKHEVDIPVGETIIGRGPVMQCTDKRVSRTHAQIKVSEDGKIELTSTSQNPCYYKDGKVISKSTSVELNIGDQFSFLPDSYCYCVRTHEAIRAELSEEMASTSDNFKNNDKSEEPMSTEVIANNNDTGKETNESSLTNSSLSNSCRERMIVPQTDADITTDTSSDVIGVCTYSDNQKNSLTDASLDSVKKYVPRWLLAATERVKSGEGSSSLANEDTKKTEEDDTVRKAVPSKRKINDAEVAPDDSLKKVVPPKRKINDHAEVAPDDTVKKTVLPKRNINEDRSEVAPDDTVKKAVPPKRKINDCAEVVRDDTLKKAIPPKKKINEDRADIAPVAGAHQLSDDSDTEEPTKENNAQQSVDTEHTGAGTEEKAQNNPDSPGNSHSPSRVARDSCRYGASCYRKNSQHRAEFSHPGDPDYKDDNRPECPYGTDCYRRNPLHKQSYKHTKKQSKKRQKTKETAETDENSEEDDEYDYDDPFLNDGSSDDYEPTDSDSDVSASEGEDEEDMKRTKKEAKRFIRGKRRH